MTVKLSLAVVPSAEHAKGRRICGVLQSLAVADGPVVLENQVIYITVAVLPGFHGSSSFAVCFSVSICLPAGEIA